MSEDTVGRGSGKWGGRGGGGGGRGDTWYIVSSTRREMTDGGGRLAWSLFENGVTTEARIATRY